MAGRFSATVVSGTATDYNVQSLRFHQGIDPWPAPISCRLRDLRTDHGRIRRVCRWLEVGMGTAPLQDTTGRAPRKTSCKHFAISVMPMVVRGRHARACLTRYDSRFNREARRRMGPESFSCNMCASGIIVRSRREFFSSMRGISDGCRDMPIVASRRWRNVFWSPV